VISIEAVTKVFPTSRGPLPVLREVDLRVAAGEFVGLVGPSGSGKSTLLHLVTGIDRPTHGRVLVGGQELARLNEDQLARWRGQHLGIVFQFFQLLPTLTALENVILPMEFGRRGGDRRRRALDLLEQVGLARLADHLPAELSGGEQQRVAIARALANDPPLLVADEPTGNLDSATGQEVIELFRTLCDGQRTLLLVTHDPALARVAGRVVRLHDGRVAADHTW
jgi:putative ABC transport system ATP-binding protein